MPRAVRNAASVSANSASPWVAEIVPPGQLSHIHTIDQHCEAEFPHSFRIVAFQLHKRHRHRIKIVRGGVAPAFRVCEDVDGGIFAICSPGNASLTDDCVQAIAHRIAIGVCFRAGIGFGDNRECGDASRGCYGVGIVRALMANFLEPASTGFLKVQAGQKCPPCRQRRRRASRLQ